MMELFAGREPQRLYSFLHDVFSIPRISRHEEQIAQYLVDFAATKGLWCYRDDIHNVLIRKPASPGYGHLPPVLLEGHTDMVAAKAPDSNHDFLKDPVELIVEGNICKANKTTLGADNGCAVAIMLAILDDPDLIHPELECIFTAQEEIGLLGIMGFDLNQIKSRRVIGLDAGSEGVFRKGVSTKYNRTFQMPVNREPVFGTVCTLTVDGLRGGHHSVAIPLDRANAIKLMGRLLHSIRAHSPIRLVEIGRIMGQKENSSAESCMARFVIPEVEGNAVRQMVERESGRIREEYQSSDPDIRIRLKQEADTQTQAMSQQESEAVIHCAYLLPYGAIRRVDERPDEPKCYSLIKNIRTEQDRVEVDAFVSTEKRCYGTALMDEVTVLCELTGMRLTGEETEFGWDPEPHSPIREAMCSSYVELFGREPIINVSHGGNDCMYLKEQIPTFDVVTTAATYLDYHTPNETLYLDSFEKVHLLVARTLTALCKDSEVNG